MDPSDLDSIKEDVDYYIESAGDDEGALGVDDEFDIYEDLNLDAILVSAGEEGLDAAGVLIVQPVLGAPDSAGRTPEVVALDPEANALGVAAAAAILKKIPPPIVPAALGKPLPLTPSKASPPLPASPAKSVALPYGTKQMPTMIPTSPSKSAEPPSPLSTSMPYKLDNSFGQDLPPAVPSSWAAHASGPPAPGPSPLKLIPPTASSFRIDIPTSPPLGPQHSLLGHPPSLSSPRPDSLTASSGSQQLQQPIVQGAGVGTGVLPGVQRTGPPAQQGAHQQGSQSIPASQTLLQQQQSQQFAPPHAGQQGYNPNAATNQGSGRGSLQLNSEVQFTISMLKQSALNSTEVFESDRLTGYVPRNQYNTHPSFPSQPPLIIESGALFERLPADTLFFSFYHQQGSYQQFLAAKQLKKQSWRFHKKYMTWFQRHEEPKVTSDDYEEGTYVYFDYESGWCQRIKSEFKFEYNYLEDDQTQSSMN